MTFKPGLTEQTWNERLSRKLEAFAKTFEDCLEVVLAIKDGTATPEGVARFQSRLYHALLELSRAYHVVRRRRERLIARKDRLPAAYHASRQKQLAHHQETLVNAISVGRSLGDAFLWFFYRNDAELFRQHRKQPPLSLPPAGDGGEGELAFVDIARTFGDKLLLFHGITNLFRLGDASLYDIKAERVVGVGELKTTRIDENQLNLQFIASMNPDASMPSAQPLGQAKPVFPALDSVRKDRLDKQMATISNVCASAQKPPIAKVDLRAGTMAHVDELNALVRAVKPGEPAAHRLSPGLFAVATHTRHSAMSSRLDQPEFDSPIALMTTLTEDLKTLSLSDSPHNCLIIGEVFYGTEWKPFLVSGATPPLLWPLDSEVQRALATGRVKVITLFNPAHILHRLQELGVKVESFKPPASLSLSIESNGKVIALERAESFLQLVYTSLYTEDYAAFSASEVLRNLKDSPVGDSPRVDLTMSHHVFF